MQHTDTFQLGIKPMCFVPDIADRFHDNRRVHFIGYGKCNYRCEFCSFGQWKVEKYPEYTLDTFEKKTWELLRYSKNFKFTGGEPTLNPFLADILRRVKIYGAQVFLDTNGSNPKKVRELIEEGLVDILGVSLKGLSADEAAKTANIVNKKLCWDNVFETIDIGCKSEGVSVIVTYVACDGYFKEEDLDVLAELFKDYPDITLKINNCYLEECVEFRRKGLDKTEIYNMVERFVERHPEYKGRMVLFRDHDACLDESKIAFF